MEKKINFFKKLKTNISDFFFKFRYGTVMFLVGIIIAFWDLFLKLFTDNGEQTIIKGVLSFYSTHNSGAAWSILSDSTTFLIIISIIFIIAILIFNWFYKNKTYFYAISVGLILSGAICNLYDRIVFGYVRDFIKLDFINFPVFNIADCAISVGVVLLCVYFIFSGKTKKANDEDSSNNAIEDNKIE